MDSLTALPTRWSLTLVALLALLIAACADDAAPGAPGTDPAPAEQQVLRLRLGAEPRSMDPHLGSTVTEATLARQLFSGLFTYDEDLNIVPDLAKTVPTVANGGISADGMTYTIELREDARWSDGAALTAGDFVYSMRRALDPDVAGPYASFFYSIEGARELNSALGTANEPRTPTAEELSVLRQSLGVKAQDDHTLVYRLVEPNPSFLNLLALWTAFPVRQDVVERHGAAWTEPGNHVGNGPFLLSEWARDQKMVLTANQNWHREKARLSRLEINFIADDAAAYAAYLAGEIDAVTLPPAAIRDVAKPGSQLHDELTIASDLSTMAFFLNNEAEPFDNKLVRQAFGMAIDRNAYVDGVLQGAGVPATSWIPPGMPGYDPSLGKQYEFNPEKAKKLLTQAGYAGGADLPKVTFIMVASDTNRIVGQFVQDQLKRNLGVDVAFDYVEGSVYGPAFTSGNYQATIQRWSADWPYPDNWLPDLFGTGRLNNLVGYSNAAFDELMEKALTATDEAKRLEYYQAGHQLILDEAAIMPLYNRVVYVLVKPHVRNVTFTAIDGAIKGDYSFARAYIAAEPSN